MSICGSSGNFWGFEQPALGAPRVSLFPLVSPQPLALNAPLHTCLMTTHAQEASDPGFRIRSLGRWEYKLLNPHNQYHLALSGPVVQAGVLWIQKLERGNTINNATHAGKGRTKVPAQSLWFQDHRVSFCHAKIWPKRWVYLNVFIESRAFPFKIN